MNKSFFDFESNEQDQSSQGMFLTDEENQEPNYEDLMSHLQSDKFSDDCNRWKNEQQDQNTSTKKQTPLDYDPFCHKEEDSLLHLQNELNTNLYFYPDLEVGLENINQEEEIKSKSPVAADNQQPIQNILNRKTKFISKKKKQVRIDYLIKKIKVSASKKMTNYANSLLVPFKNKFYKLSKPSSKEYTSITKAAKNRAWLEKQIKEIFVLGKDTESGALQKNNYEVIKKIEDLEENETSIKIKEFLEMTLEDYYTQIFFDSDEFKKFCEDKDVISLDEEFKRERGDSLRKKSAFIKLIP